jgi:superfamily II DNA/RNA helicase
VVINMSIGMSINDYVHRCGRTGRSGEKGLAYTFLVQGDEHLSPALLSVLHQSGQRVPSQLIELSKQFSVKEARASKIRGSDEEDDRLFVKRLT